ANVMAMASEVSGESFLIATGVDSSVNDIVAILLKLTGSPLKPRHRDEPGKVQTTTKAALGFLPAKAKRLLGWEAAVGVEDGIRRLIAWAEGSNRPQGRLLRIRTLGSARRERVRLCVQHRDEPVDPASAQ